jgi:hypothetical protein
MIPAAEKEIREGGEFRRKKKEREEKKDYTKIKYN